MLLFTVRAEPYNSGEDSWSLGYNGCAFSPDQEDEAVLEVWNLRFMVGTQDSSLRGLRV